MSERGLRDAARHLGAQLPHGRTLPEGEWRARHRVLLWLLWAHVAGDAGHLAAVRPGPRPGGARLRDRRRLGRARAAQARRAARAVADRDARPADHVGADRPRLRRQARVLLPLLRDGRGAVALRGLGPVRRRGRLRADPAGDHGRDRRLRPRRVAVAVGADPLGVHRRAERGAARHLAGVGAQPRGVPLARGVARGGRGDGRRDRGLVAANPSARRILGMDPARVLVANRQRRRVALRRPTTASRWPRRSARCG